MNTIEIIQRNLGYSGLEKIDPNTQQPQGGENQIGNHALAQAGIPSVVLGIFNRLEQEPVLDPLFKNDKCAALENIFGKQADEVVRRVREYAQTGAEDTRLELEHIAAETLRIVRDSTGGGLDAKTVRTYVANNKPDILLYLPPSLEMGKLLRNNNLDDRTGKMEGPVSSFMHSVEKKFNTSE